MLSSHSVVSSSRTIRPCSPWGGRWIGHWRKTWSTVCSSAPHLQAAGEAIPRFVQAEAETSDTGAEAVKLDTGPSLEGHSGGVCAGVGDENRESCEFVRPLRIPLAIRPLRRTYVVVVRWADEMLCGGYKWVFRFETPCVCTLWTGDRWVEQMSRLQWHGVLETVWFHFDEAQQVGCLRGLEGCPLM